MSKACWISLMSSTSTPPFCMPANSSHSLPKPQLPTFLPASCAGCGDALVLERDLRGRAALEDLGDVGDLGALLDRAEHLRHPGDRVVHVAGRQHVLRHDVRPALDDLDVEALLFVVALVDRRVVAGELRLRHPLQLQLDLDRLGRLALADCRWPPVPRRPPPPHPASTSSAALRPRPQRLPRPSAHLIPSQSCPVISETADAGWTTSPGPTLRRRTPDRAGSSRARTPRPAGSCCSRPPR